jgi:dTDP-glucose 4,6-dehydratase
MMAIDTATVTGGPRCLTSARAPALIGHRVVCVHDLETGSLQNIEHIHAGRDFTFVNQDLIQPLCLDEPLDVVFHLASPASPIDY